MFLNLSMDFKERLEKKTDRFQGLQTLYVSQEKANGFWGSREKEAFGFLGDSTPKRKELRVELEAIASRLEAIPIRFQSL